MLQPPKDVKPVKPRRPKMLEGVNLVLMAGIALTVLVVVTGMIFWFIVGLLGG